jgi:hypothetical protein
MLERAANACEVCIRPENSASVRMLTVTGCGKTIWRAKPLARTDADGDRSLWSRLGMHAANGRRLKPSLRAEAHATRHDVE